MVYELVNIRVKPGKREDWFRAARSAWREAGFDGCQGGMALTCVEDETRVAFIVRWDSVEAHVSHRGTPAHRAFRHAIDPYLDGRIEVLHFDEVPGWFD